MIVSVETLSLMIRTGNVQLTKIEQVILIALLVSLPSFLIPGTANASVQNKTRLIVEIKDFPIIKIPEMNDIPKFSEIPIIIDGQVTIESQNSIQIVNIEVPKKVYMHEPEIRAYVCPKLGNRCNTFIAILKAENGTHECTRDNKGLNKNGSLDVGLAQINWNEKYHPPYTIEQLRDCKFNLDIALRKIETRGFQPWYAYTKGAYKKHLRTASSVN